MKMILTIFALICLMSGSYAQQCGSEEANKRIQKEYPNAVNYSVTQNKKDRGDSLIIIPVVFHVLHEGGPENISDAQVESAIIAMNEVFQHRHGDTASIDPDFKGRVGNMNLEFRLAKKDPTGAATNGIDRIFTSLTGYGSDFARLNQWDRNRYMNVWVVDRFSPSNGQIGQAYYPETVAENYCFADGIMILHTYVGSIGTSAVYNATALAHEVGHYFGLKHPNHGYNGNQPGAPCGDDGIEDTPPAGISAICNNPQSECNPGFKENVENHMMYRYCAKMFTKGQKDFVRGTLASSVAGRNTLGTKENLLFTGVLDTSSSLAKPKVELMADTRLICEGGSVNFKAIIGNASNCTYTWSFPTGTPSESTEENPTVLYTTGGQKNVKLTVTNNGVSTAVEQEKWVYVSQSWYDHLGSYLQDFDNEPSYYLEEHPIGMFEQFHLASGVGKDQSKAYKLNLFTNNTLALGCGAEQPLAIAQTGSEYTLYTESYNLQSTTNTMISFDYAYTTRTPNVDYMTEEMNFFYSDDCGETWKILKKIGKENLLTTPYKNTEFIPVSNSEWKTVNINFNKTPLNDQTRFRISFTSSEFANNLYIDNFQVSGLLRVPTASWQENVRFSPNPVQVGNEVAISVENFTTPLNLKLIGLNGQEVLNQTLEPTTEEFKWMIPATVKAGYYFIQLNDGQVSWTEKIVVF